jgi:hypothetical protein
VPSRGLEPCPIWRAGHPHPYPRPCPRGGDTPSSESVLVSPVFYRGLAAWRHPRLRSVLWLARQACWVDAALAKNLPHRSRDHEYTDGRVYELRPIKDIDVLYGMDEWNEFRGRVLGRRSTGPVCQYGTAQPSRCYGFTTGYPAPQSGSGRRQRLGSFRRQSGLSCLRPLDPPPAGGPPVLKHPKTLPGSGRASRDGF